MRMKLSNDIRKNQQRDDLRAYEGSGTSIEWVHPTIGSIRQTVRSDRQANGSPRRQVRSYRSTRTVNGRQGRWHPYFLEHATGQQHSCDKCSNVSGGRVRDHSVRVTQPKPHGLKPVALAMALSFTLLSACAPEVSSQDATPPGGQVPSQETSVAHTARTRAECRAMPVREDVRACLEEIIAIGQSEIEQIRVETEALRAENERLDAEIDKRLDAFAASVTEDVEVPDPD